MRTDQQPVRIALFAPEGRMGQAIQAAIAEDAGFELDNDNGEVLVDFSSPNALRASLDRAVSAGVPLLIGTTGLIEEHEALIADAAKIVPILRAPNTSIGVALLTDLVERAARVLAPEHWDIEIVEAHHNKKADAPSGTALHLGTAADRGRGDASPQERGRDGTGLARQKGAIGYSAIRGGTVAGDHDVMFFARGALAAARFLKGKHAGLYTMRDVIEAA